jgi:hypothetical protein
MTGWAWQHTRAASTGTDQATHPHFCQLLFLRPLSLLCLLVGSGKLLLLLLS